jgi:hypothetical protein
MKAGTGAKPMFLGGLGSIHERVPKARRFSSLRNYKAIGTNEDGNPDMRGILRKLGYPEFT